MPKPISQQLSDLSVHAKHAEDAVAAAQKEAHDEVMARREQARAAATAAIEKVDHDLKSAGDVAASRWNTLQAKIATDIDALKAGVAQRMHDRDVRRAENNAERLEWEASVAVDYAIASVEQAELAVLDAIAGRIEAAEMRSS
jgi:hypothetical protein